MDHFIHWRFSSGRSSFYPLLVLIVRIYMVFKCWHFGFHSFILAWIGIPFLFTWEERNSLRKKIPDLSVATSVIIPCLLNNDWYFIIAIIIYWTVIGKEELSRFPSFWCWSNFLFHRWCYWVILVAVGIVVVE